MKRNQTQVLIASLILSASLVSRSYAAPVLSNPIELAQPSSAGGHRFTVVERGDEWSNWSETGDGYSVVRDRDTGVWHYAQKTAQGRLESIGAVVGRDKPAAWGLKKHLRPDPTARSFAGTGGLGSGASAPNAVGQTVLAPTLGNVPTLFILVKFLNRNNTYTAADFAAFQANQLRAYFNEASYGRMQTAPAFENHGGPNDGVIGWLTLNQNHPNTQGSTGDANRRVVAAAIVAADPYINYGNFDVNRDGYVDATELAVVVIPAGYETAYGGSNYAGKPSVWGHRWSLGWGAVAAPSVDGVYVGHYHNDGGYAQFGEIHGYGTAYSDHQATLGIMAHELGHLIMKWPDLYDTDGSSGGLGSWSLMSGGSWAYKAQDAYQGETPVHPDAWCKLQAGWVSPVANTVGAFSLPAVGSGTATSANAVQVQRTSDPNQYFLFENRSQYGFDRGLYSIGASTGGIAVYHINESMTGNQNEAIRLVDLEAADGSDYSAPTNLFYAGNQTRFDDTTTPNSDLYAGVGTAIALNTVSPAMQDMTANFGAPATTDQDSDGVADSIDNCAVVANASQCDSDGDGYGNQCDADLNNDGFSNAQDVVVFRQAMGAASFAPTYHRADLNCNGFVNAQDATAFRRLLGVAPGPSGLHP